MYMYLSQLKPRCRPVACDMVRLAAVIAKLECGECGGGLSRSSNATGAMKSLWGRRACSPAMSRARSSEAFCERGHGER